MARRPRKQQFCLKEKGDGLKCPSCLEKFPMIEGMEPVDGGKIDEALKEIENDGRIRECFSCNHQVIVCNECREDHDPVICPCCCESEREEE